MRQNILFSYNHLICYYISYPFASKDMITVEISAFQQRPKWSIHWVSRASFFPWAPWSSRSIDFPVDLLPFMDKTAFISGFRAFCTFLEFLYSQSSLLFTPDLPHLGAFLFSLEHSFAHFPHYFGFFYFVKWVQKFPRELLIFDMWQIFMAFHECT